MSIPLPAARTGGPPYFVTAIFDRDSSDPRSLKLKPRDKVEVLRPVSKTDDFFWGAIGSRIGRVPTRYVRDTDRLPPLGADNIHPWHGLDPILMKFRLRDL
ncbi:hypothetical protein BDV97DRAFT_37781 [Delphinella strobiligena]|nr:hypothetical protein BDV97DRAFT_37781 [Delphinella strobiligena]